MPDQYEFSAEEEKAMRDARRAQSVPLPRPDPRLRLRPGEMMSESAPLGSDTPDYHFGGRWNSGPLRGAVDELAGERLYSTHSPLGGPESSIEVYGTPLQKTLRA